MKYWIGTLSASDFEVVVTKGVWEFPLRSVRYILEMSSGDVILAYVKEKREKSKKESDTDAPGVRGLFSVAGRPYYDDKPVFTVGKSTYRPIKVRVTKIAVLDRPITPQELRDLLAKSENSVNSLIAKYTSKPLSPFPENAGRAVEVYAKRSRIL